MVENTKYTRFDLNNNCRQTHTLFRQDPTLKEMAQNEQSSPLLPKLLSATEGKKVSFQNTVQFILFIRQITCSMYNSFD